MKQIDLVNLLLPLLIKACPSGAVVETSSPFWECPYCGGNKWFIVAPWCAVWTGYCVKCLYKQMRLLDVDACQSLFKGDSKSESKKPVQKEV